MINVEDVRAGLRATAVLDHFGAKYTDEPQIRLRECPRCKVRSRREAIVIDRQSGNWIHHSGGSAEASTCKGDMLELVAAFEGLDRSRDFRRLLEVAAPIAGITPGIDDAERTRLRDERRREQLAYDRDRAERRARATAAIPATWDGLARANRRHAEMSPICGTRYLQHRGLDAAELVARDVVRFDARGNPCVRLFSFDTCSPINILTRQIDGDPKVLSTEDCTTDGSIIGRIAEIDRDGVDVAVIVEGVTDALAAVLAFPGCAVLGANGAGKLASVAAAVAPKLAEINGWLLIVPDVDGGTGESHAADAVLVAMNAGLVLDKSIHLVDVRPHKDLADAWRTGWKWSWPS